eukprot:TRINITY_DN7585_c0_g1_i1.p1 TRINITY_DN7585_c0_g1~~TRINITY_DN7585_c0_g1_i1.p1  ORF type:complete len:361 (+),score=93.65 TRINITY_DN7585_c0_g1_i1:66-1148(+)
MASSSSSCGCLPESAFGVDPTSPVSDESPAAGGRGRKKMPEIHGGPEGVYQKDKSTGRWRSVSRGGTVRERGSQEVTDDSYVAGTRKAFDSALEAAAPPPAESALGSELAGAGRGDDECKDGELAALQAKATAAREETSRLWASLSEIMADSAAAKELTREGRLSRLQEEADFESQRRDAVWKLMKERLDMSTYSALVRKMKGLESDGINLSVDAGRRLFEKAADTPVAADAAGGGYPASAPAARTANTPSRMRRSSSRPSLTSLATDAKAREQSSSRPALSRGQSGALGKGKQDVQTGQLREQLFKQMKDTQVGKEIGGGLGGASKASLASAPSLLSKESPLVRSRVSVFEHKVNCGGA